jgi:4-hydroxy-3-polyprenylbenzoate decarboxylase
VPELRTITLAITGASGSLYAAELLRAAAHDDRIAKINLVVSENALRVLAEELHLSGRNDLVENSSAPHPLKSSITPKPTSVPTSPAAATPPTP